MKDYSFIADIAAFITDNDSEVVSKLRECANDPWAYAGLDLVMMFFVSTSRMRIPFITSAMISVPLTLY